MRYGSGSFYHQAKIVSLFRLILIRGRRTQKIFIIFANPYIKLVKFGPCRQCCGSGSEAGLDPGPGGQKWPTKIEKKGNEFHFLKLIAEGFSCNLDVLYGGLGISKLQFFDQKYNFFSAYIFFLIFDHQTQCTCDNTFYDYGGKSKPWIRSGSLEMLDQDPYSMNLDRQHCWQVIFYLPHKLWI
jgi:hypothetical protein